MTFTALALSLALQTPINAMLDPNEVEYLQVLTNLSSNQTLFLHLTGNVLYRGKTTAIVSNLSWSSGTVATGSSGSKPQLQAEIEENVNGVLIKRIVADGNTLWTYDLNTHEYSATSYGGYGSARPPNYQNILLSDLNAVADGPTAYLTKLLRQIYNLPEPYIVLVPIYSSWMPGVVSINEGIGSFPDPVNPYLTYSQPNGGQTSNFYLYNGSPKRTVVFQITPGNGSSSEDQLASIYFNQMDQLGRNPRLTAWTITPYTTPTFATYLFQPYSGAQTAGWKAVVGPKPTTN